MKHLIFLIFIFSACQVTPTIKGTNYNDKNELIEADTINLQLYKYEVIGGQKFLQESHPIIDWVDDKGILLINVKTDTGEYYKAGFFIRADSTGLYSIWF